MTTDPDVQLMASWAQDMTPGERLALCEQRCGIPADRFDMRWRAHHPDCPYVVTPRPHSRCWCTD